MKRQQAMAVILSAMMAVSPCGAMSGINAFAAELPDEMAAVSEETGTDEEIGATEEDDVLFEETDCTEEGQEFAADMVEEASQEESEETIEEASQEEAEDLEEAGAEAEEVQIVEDGTDTETVVEAVENVSIADEADQETEPSEEAEETEQEKTCEELDFNESDLSDAENVPEEPEIIETEEKQEIAEAEEGQAAEPTAEEEPTVEPTSEEESSAITEEEVFDGSAAEDKDAEEDAAQPELQDSEDPSERSVSSSAKAGQVEEANVGNGQKSSDAIATGECGKQGDNLLWELTGEGDDLTLTITGSGDMVEYDDEYPWGTYTDQIKTIIFDVENGTVGWISHHPALETLVIDGARVVGGFKYNENLRDIQISEGLEETYEQAFYRCTSLESISLPDSFVNPSSSEFSNCSALNNVKLSQNLKGISAYMFEACSSLSKIDLPDSITYVGPWAFSRCTSLEEIILPDGTQKIRTGAFKSCTSLTKITIPETVTQIDEDVFAECTQQFQIIFGGTRAQWDALNVNDLPSGAEVVCMKKISIASAAITGITNKTYTGKALTQKITVKDGSKTLTAGTDYTVTYKNNTNAGTAKVIITGTGEYGGTVTKTFTIAKAANSITANNITCSYSGKARTVAIGAKAAGGKLTYKSNRSNVPVSAAGKVTIPAKFSGTTKITITAGDSNHKTVTKTITVVVPAKTSLTSVTSTAAGRMVVKWAANAAAAGYQIQYSTTSDFASAKTVTAVGGSKTGKTVLGLTSGKRYYVRVRNYKKVDGKNYYSGWSAAKSVTIKK